MKIAGRTKRFEQLALKYPNLAIATYHRPFDFSCLGALLLAAGYKHLTPTGIRHFDGGSRRPVMLRAL
jgi:hypothetical protein